MPVEFRPADVLGKDLGEPFDVLFDRRVDRYLRAVDLVGFQRVLERVRLSGSLWSSLTGRARERQENDPPKVSEAELRTELEPLFEIIELREFRFSADKADVRALGRAIPMRRRCSRTGAPRTGIEPVFPG